MDHDEEMDTTVVVLTLLRLSSYCHLSDLINGLNVYFLEDYWLKLLHSFEVR
jgi:hypothetical protein